MAGRIKRSYVLAALIFGTASFVYLAASGDPAKPADKPKKKPAAKAEQAAPGTAHPTPAKEAPANDPAAPVATIGDRTISMQDLALNLAQKMMNQWEFEQKKQALDEMINEQLIDKEAAAKGISKEKLLETEVTSKVTDPQAGEVDAWYEQNKARVGAQTKEQMAPQISAFLKNQKAQEVQKTFTAGLRQKYGVKVLMKPTRYEVSVDDDAAKGPAKAPVTIVEFSDYQCPFCSRAESTVADVLKKYGDKIRLIYRDYPLSMHPNAQVAAEASECAKDQGKFWEMHNAMFANQQKLASADLVETAGTLGLDKDKFKACLDSGKKRDEVQKDFADGMKVGVTGTPTFFINGLRLVGARDVNSFAEIIDQELQEKKQ
jgi:protein-disulfide isomerase